MFQTSLCEYHKDCNGNNPFHLVLLNIKLFHFPHSKAFFYRMHLRHTGGYSETRLLV
nr:MAG TPA: hypothetical protein [Caudoviricetes sp.]